MVTLGVTAISSEPAALPVLSLDARLGLLRRRRRLTLLKRYALVGPVVLGMSLVLLAGFAGAPGLR